ncbi:MAG: hypothetical protein ACK5LY_10850 [Lachnospirales bacterium]
MIDFNSEVAKFKPALKINEVADKVRNSEQDDIYDLLKKIIEMKES